MGKRTLNPESMPIPRGSYSQVTIAKPGRLVFIAGNTANDPGGMTVGVGDVRVQTRHALTKLIRGMEAAGGTKDDLVVLTVSTTDVRYHRDINEVRREGSRI